MLRAGVRRPDYAAYYIARHRKLCQPVMSGHGRPVTEINRRHNGCHSDYGWGADVVGTAALRLLASLRAKELNNN